MKRPRRLRIGDHIKSDETPWQEPLLVTPELVDIAMKDCDEEFQAVFLLVHGPRDKERDT
jgi:hypothetical protein